MEIDTQIKMFNDVFAPKTGEKILFLIDKPHDDIKDSNVWKGRREMAFEWYTVFKKMGEENQFSVDILEYPATGIHNSPIPKKILQEAFKSNLVLAMTEYSATSSLASIRNNKDVNIRVASMPMIEKRMEETALKADYAEVASYAMAIEKMLNNAVGADISFSTGDHLYLDLRNRTALSDKGDCSKPGQFINFPSGESCKVPYEATSDEIDEYGESKTEGVLPAHYNNEIVRFEVKNNKVVNVLGDNKKAEEMKRFFEENDTHRNIAELGIGCNPNAVITGNILEDEKVGLHIAYGMSAHLGGKVDSDMHQDICYSKGLPVEGTTVTLNNSDGSKTELIKDSMLRYELLK